MDDTRDDRTAERFAELALELHDTSTVVETVDAVVEFALHAVSCEYAGVALVHRSKRLEPAAITDPIVADVTALEAELGEGPALWLLQHDYERVVISDLQREKRWPDWSSKAAGLGLRSGLFRRLYVGHQVVGMLVLFHGKPRMFTAEDDAIAHILARHASVALATARNQESLAEAIDARKLVGQAMGILMERHQIDGDRAFSVLRRYSQHNNIKLRDVAQELIDTRRLPET